LATGELRFKRAGNFRELHGEVDLTSEWGDSALLRLSRAQFGPGLLGFNLAVGFKSDAQKVWHHAYEGGVKEGEEDVARSYEMGLETGKSMAIEKIKANGELCALLAVNDAFKMFGDKHMERWDVYDV